MDWTRSIWSLRLLDEEIAKVEAKLAPLDATRKDWFRDKDCYEAHVHAELTQQLAELKRERVATTLKVEEIRMTAPFGKQPITEAENMYITEVLSDLSLLRERASSRKQGSSKVYYLQQQDGEAILNQAVGCAGWASEVKLRPEALRAPRPDKDGRNYSALYMCIVKTMLRNGAYHEDVGCGIMRLPDEDEAVKNAIKASVTDARKRSFGHYGPAVGSGLKDKDEQQAMAEWERNGGGVHPPPTHPYFQQHVSQPPQAPHQYRGHVQGPHQAGSRSPPPPPTSLPQHIYGLPVVQPAPRSVAPSYVLDTPATQTQQTQASVGSGAGPRPPPLGHGHVPVPVPVHGQASTATTATVGVPVLHESNNNNNAGHVHQPPAKHHVMSAVVPNGGGGGAGAHQLMLADAENAALEQAERAHRAKSAAAASSSVL